MKLLVIEDNADVRDSLIQVLRECSYLVDASDNGEEGLYRALNWEYDAIILDVMLPDLDGWQVLKRLRKTKTTPVLMLTARGELDDRVRGLNAGADDYVAKPYEAKELLARLRALMRRSTGQASDCIELNRVRIDTATSEVTLDGDPVYFTPGEYRLLLYLAKRSGTLVGRAEIDDALSTDDCDGVSNVVGVQIHHIRKKLGRDFVQTKRGLGYLIPKP